MNKLELKAIKEACELLQSFEGYKFYGLVSSTGDAELIRSYEELSKEQHTKIDKAKHWLDAVLMEQK